MLRSEYGRREPRELLVNEPAEDWVGLRRGWGWAGLIPAILTGLNGATPLRNREETLNVIKMKLFAPHHPQQVV
jgi:hypothetical protein